MRHPDADLAAARSGRRLLRLYLIKPSQYDAEGTVWSFRWGVVPNNTLTVLAGLAADWATARPAIDLQTVLWEELVDGVISPALIDALGRRAAADGAALLVGVAGVQTGQYARARDIALQLRAAGVAVACGGFHITSHAPSRAFLTSHGVSVVIGEAETTLAALLDDHLAGRLQPEYRVGDGLRVRTGLGTIAVPDIEAAPLPAIDARYLRRFFNPTLSTVDTARGCPFACSYCAVKNVMGRTMRARDPARVVAWVRHAHDAHGVRSLFLVDDDLYRSPSWEALFTGLAALRAEGRALSFMMQADVEASLVGDGSARAARSRRFVDLAAAAGCYAVFVGFESFNPDNLAVTLKVQNQDRADRRAAGGCDAAARGRVLARYRDAVTTWHAAGVAVHAGYMVGLPHDGRGAGAAAARDLLDIGVDLTSFFPYTPLPGTEDYDAALSRGDMLSGDFNDWDCLHIVNRHPTLTRAEVYREYCDAHRTFYGWRRLAGALLGGDRGLSATARWGMLTQQVYYTYAYRRGWHPMMGGLWRLRDRSVRRQAISDAAAARTYRSF
ncbi:MAG: B12-binding domain-containing radical SAM protein [Candidatus Binatia bacterium]